VEQVVLAPQTLVCVERVLHQVVPVVQVRHLLILLVVVVVLVHITERAEPEGQLRQPVAPAVARVVAVD
jgi:hypothetical protein